MRPPFFSIIIPVRHKTAYLKETLTHLKQQTFRQFEILVITDKISGTANPAQKRNLGAKKAQGLYLAFLDDDSYPHSNWLENSYNQIQQHPNFAAFCGPSLTPPKDNPYQQASGLVWGSLLGSGGAGRYRNQANKPRFVDDFPSVNLIVKKSDFFAIKGFTTHHWPGEDTILCLNLTQKLHKKIYYHPSIQVFHHRRPIIKHHLQQITRYALHRGHFARIYPKTSLRLGYLGPSAFFIYLLVLPLFINHISYIIYPLCLYLLLLFLTFLNFFYRHNFRLAILATVTIPITHLYYGILFLIGFFTPKLNFNPHQTNKHGYIGG